MAEYAYVMKVGGLVYTATDVDELHQWMTSHLESHPLFTRLSPEEACQDPVVHVTLNATHESKKAKKEQRGAQYAVFRRTEPED